MKEINNPYSDKKVILKECPFCRVSEHIEIRFIGNDHSTSRKIITKCKKCRIQRTDATLRHGFDWLIDIAAKNWNERNESR